MVDRPYNVVEAIVKCIRPTLAPLVMMCLTIYGCGGGGGNGDAGENVAKAACESLVGKRVAAVNIGLPTNGAVITGAVFVPVTSIAPEYCRVTGEIESIDPVAQPILFESDMPTAWNGKVLQLGGSGWDGNVSAAMGSAGMLAPPTPIARGFVTFGSDGGHESVSGDASFAANAEQLQNFGGDAVKKTRDAVWSLVNLRYGRLPSRTYFLGGSTGGREAFAAFQRWPDDYDGVIALYPAFDWTPLFMKLQQIGVAMRVDAGVGWFDSNKASALMTSTLTACDGLDGIADRLISNVDACKFVAETIRCPTGADSSEACLSDAQLHTLSIMTSASQFPYTLANGVTSFPGFNVGADWASVVGTLAVFEMPPNIAQLGAVQWYADGLVRYLLLQDLNANTLTFDPLNPGPSLARLQQVSGILDQTNTHVAQYLGHGGKLILLHGTTDAQVATQSTVNYYLSLATSFGQAQVDASVRLYLVPGFGHGTGTFNPLGSLPLLDALDTWVEAGTPPSSLVMADMNATTAGRTRPMCVYPTWQKYLGSGDPNAAASFSCVAD